MWIKMVYIALFDYTNINMTEYVSSDSRIHNLLVFFGALFYMNGMHLNFFHDGLDMQTIAQSRL